MLTKTELFVIVARNGSVAVIFRRGPSKQVLLIKWNLNNDTFETGQWFKGRIYECRCDLSPSGDLLVYFAAKHQLPMPGWTAISKPPYLTALALWPKYGTWGGGGLFESEYTLLLNHCEGEDSLDDNFHLNKNMKVRPLGEHSAKGGDNPVYHTRLIRDGWVLKQQGTYSEYQLKGPMRWECPVPLIYEKTISREKKVLALQMQLRGVGERQGDGYVLDHEVLDEQGNSLLKLPRTSWADWSNDALLFAEKGSLFRLPWSRHDPFNRKHARELANFGNLRFEAKAAPRCATRW